LQLAEAGHRQTPRQIAFGSRPDPAQAIRQQLREAPEPMVYQPLMQMRIPPDYLVGVVRTTGEPSSVTTRVRGVVRDLSTQLAVGWVRTMREQMNAALVAERLLVGLSVAFGLLALVLGGIGVYGVIAYDVARRTREIGIRLALGALRRTVVAAVLRQLAAVVAPGLIVGLGGGMMASALVDTFLYGITPRDPLTLAGTTIVLGAIALAAAYLPARRAARVNPAITLRAE
jgi:ABC-type antimicrobial peptide transport system permease subunit